MLSKWFVFLLMQITQGNKSESSRTVTQLHYTGWLDFGVPANTRDLLALNQIKNTFVDSTGQRAAPVVVHCSAGVGRTGTLIGLDTITKTIEEEDSNQLVDIYKCVFQMREDRGFLVITIIS